jgi:hypothetical protein
LTHIMSMNRVHDAPKHATDLTNGCHRHHTTRKPHDAMTNIVFPRTTRHPRRRATRKMLASTV